MIIKKCFTPLLVAALLSLEAGVTSAQNPPAAPSGLDKAAETHLLEVLKSGATYKEKSDACRALARGGTKDAVPTLAALLGDEKLNHMARYAIEEIHDPAGDAALRDALGTAKGLPLIGVISSVGAERDTLAIAPLTKLLNGGDAEITDAAAHALGRIGTLASARALMGVLAKPTPGIYDGLLRCAETLPRKGAALIYDALRQPPAPQPIRMTALRGAILARQEQGLPLLTGALRGNDNALALAAIQAARELPGTGVTKTLAAEVGSGKLAANRQLLLVQVLGARRDKIAGPQLLALAKKSDGELRAAAVRSIIQLGDATALPFLAEQAATDDVEVARVARTALVGFTGREAEAPLTAMLRSTNPKARAVAAELVSQRRMVGAMPQLLIGANDADAAVANASIKALGDIGGNPQAPALIKILTTGNSMPATESALAAIYTRGQDPSVADALAAALPTAPVAAKPSLMRLLRGVGSPKALNQIRAALTDTNAEVRENAMRTMSDWPTLDALPDLMTLAKTPPTPALKILALRGILRLIPLQNAVPEQKMTSLKAALALIERPEEKRLALSVLGDTPTAESLALVMQELANPGLKEEASVAAVAIGEQLVKTQPAAVTEAMGQVVKATQDAQLLKRAQALLAAKTP